MNFLAGVVFALLSATASAEEPVTAETCQPQPECQLIFSPPPPGPGLGIYELFSKPAKASVPCKSDGTIDREATAAKLVKACQRANYSTVGGATASSCKRNFWGFMYADVEFRCISYNKNLFFP